MIKLSCLCFYKFQVPDITVEQETPQPGGMEDVSSSVATEVPENNGQDDHHGRYLEFIS